MDINWQEYERMKRQLPDNLTPDEYEQAIIAIMNVLETEEQWNN